MKKIKYLLFVLLGLLATPYGYAQFNKTLTNAAGQPQLIIKGSVFDVESLVPMPHVNVEIAGGDYTTTNALGEFTIKAYEGDELVVRNAGFETVYYNIKGDERIRIEVKPSNSEFDTKLSQEALKQKNKQTLSYDDYIKLANESYKEDASSGLDYVANALEDKTITSKQRAEAFTLLAEIYMHWEQYDLAVTNYRLSLKNVADTRVEEDLANAYFLNKNYQESIALYNKLTKGKPNGTGNWIVLKEKLADAYTATGEIEKAQEIYQELLILTRAANQSNSAIRITAKLANSFENIGAPQEASIYFDEALELATEGNVTNKARVKVEAADYYSRTNSYDEEIALRKEILDDLDNAIGDTLPNEDALTVQKQNYKIASAYVKQRKLDEAIPFFERSIEAAENKEDIVVAKDATRRLSEVYRDKGDFEEAINNYERYMSLIDQDYTLKEQELASAKRFVKELAVQQNRIASLEKDRALNESRYQLAISEQELTRSRDIRQNIIIAALALVTLLLLITAFAMHRSSKQQKLANNLLALKGLRSQMNPHFIFNALNSVNSFIASSDERTANQYLSDFSVLMRSVLENSEEDFIPLSKEIDLLEKYVILEHFRFKDKFDYTLKVDPQLDVEAFDIPPMLLQPYLENAVWHGLRYKEEKGLLEISFSQLDSDTAQIIIKDDGVGRAKSKALKTANQKKQKSKGMSNIKERISILNAMYGDRIAVSVRDALENGEGTQVTLTLKKQ